MLILVVATDEVGGIGYRGNMPWHDVQELAHFKRMTMHHTLLMGRKTWESLPSSLEGRIVYVATHQNVVDKDGIVCLDPLTMIKEAQGSKDVLMVCGGRELYDMALPYADEIYLSIIKGTYQVDTYFPTYDKTDFKLCKKENYPTYTWYLYKRKRECLCDS